MPVSLVTGKNYLTVTFLDNAGETTIRRYETDDAYDAGIGNATLLADLNSLQALTDAIIVKADLGRSFVDPDAPAISPNVSNVKGDAAVISIALDTPTKSGSMNIPAPNIGIFLSPTGKGKNIIDASDASLLGWVNKFKSAAGKFLLDDGENANATTPVVGGTRKK